MVVFPEETKARGVAGELEPTKPHNIDKATRDIALELHFKDSKNRTVKIYAISLYLPCLLYNNNEYKVTLKQLQYLINKKSTYCIFIIEVDTNASRGIKNKKEWSYHGNLCSHCNARGNTLRECLSLDNLLATSTFKTKLV